MIPMPNDTFSEGCRVRSDISNALFGTDTLFGWRKSSLETRSYIGGVLPCVVIDNLRLLMVFLERDEEVKAGKALSPTKGGVKILKQ